MKDFEYRPNLERGDATAHVRSLGDGDLVHFLWHTRRRMAGARGDQAEAYASALAALELEAARRGIEMRGVRERVPAPVARRRLDDAVADDDPAGVRILLRWLDGPGLWRAYRYALSHPDREERVRILERVHWHLNVRLFGVDVARRRRRRAAQALRRLDAHRKAERLRTALAFMFRKYYGLREGSRG
ncbi:MAG TPA: hypothetical protein VF212_17440 [Longimicrobiales bacterium]